MSPTQRLLSDNIQHSQETDIHTPAEIEPAVAASERLLTQTSQRATTRIGI